MVDEEVREALESLNRERAWLMRAIERFPDLCIYRWDNDARYCSPSVNGQVDTFALVPVIDRSPYHDHAPEQNLAVACYITVEGKDLYAWPPKFIVGEIDDGKHRLFEHWQRQLRDAGIAPALITKIAEELSDHAIQRPSKEWINGDPDYGLWTAHDNEGEVVGVVRVHERLNVEAKCVIRARGAALGIHFAMHDGGYTIESAHDLQAFVDDTVDFYIEREADRLKGDANSRNAA